MKKQIGILILLIVSITGFGQECKYETNIKDKFTNEVQIKLKPVQLLSVYKRAKEVKLMDLQMTLQKRGDKRIFSLSLKAAYGHPQFLGTIGNEYKPSSSLIFILDNSIQIELPMMGINSDINKLYLITHFVISQENYELLLSHDIIDVRAKAIVNPFDFTVNPKVKTKGYFKCIE
jgi:hypothetical protein